MFQNTNVQSGGAQIAPAVANPPGRRLLDAAIAIYLIALATFVALAVLGIHTETSKLGASVLLIVPVAFLGMMFGFYYSVFLVSSLAGVPLIRFSVRLSAIQRNSTAISGAILLVAVASAILAFGTA